MKQVPISGEHFALVDEADYELAMSAGPWHLHPAPNTFYAKTRLKSGEGRRVTRYLHSHLTGWPLVDHVNGNGLDNRRANLRPATSSQNQANRKLRRDSASGFKGVYWYPDRNCWRARITVNRQVHSLGYFATREEAARAYDTAASDFFGEFARLNFPKEINS